MAEHDEHRLRQRAHAIWEREGRPEGRHQAHWDMAREEIANEDNQSPLNRPTPAATGDAAARGAKKTKLASAAKEVSADKPAPSKPAPSKPAPSKPAPSKKEDPSATPAPRRSRAKSTAS